MSDYGQRATIIAAIIGVIGSIAVALITNWDKITGSPNHAENQVLRSVKPAEPVSTPKENSVQDVNISGNWLDPNNRFNGSRITQDGNSFHFKGTGMLPQGIAFKSSGSGSITGLSVTYTYTLNYQNSSISFGTCSGTVSPEGARITSTCTDNVLGTYVASGVRQ